jgi:hypothetical protein
MIIFKKLPDGTWQKSGEILPTETHYTIAVDAKDRETTVYTCAEAIAKVEKQIEMGTQSYRFELAMPPASLKRKAANEKKIKKIIGHPGTSKAKKSGKKESHSEKRKRFMAQGLCGACGKRKRQPKPASKGGGHYAECRECKKYYDAKSAEYRKADKR